MHVSLEDFQNILNLVGEHLDETGEELSDDLKAVVAKVLKENSVAIVQEGEEAPAEGEHVVMAASIGCSC